MGVRVIMPDLGEAILAKLQPRVDAAIKVAERVPVILKERAILDNEDVAGNQFPKKKPRPRKNPTNFPNVALVQNETPDEMSPERWSHEQTGPTQVTVSYQPSDHHEYLVSKAPEQGGRKWLTNSEMNPNARDEIANQMREAFERGGE
jgi:hypothetical protein